MPFALVTIGLALFITALNGTASSFARQVYADLFTNKPSFLYWILALLVVGFIGYIPGAKKPADAFMALIIVGMILANGTGFFSTITNVSITTPANANPIAPVAVSTSTGAAIIPGTQTPGTPGIATGLLTGLPSSISQFFTNGLPSILGGSK